VLLVLDLLLIEYGSGKVGVCCLSTNLFLLKSSSMMIRLSCFLIGTDRLNEGDCLEFLMDQPSVFVLLSGKRSAPKSTSS